MSRLNRLSAAAIKAMFSSETDEQIAMLIEIEDPNTLVIVQSFADTNEYACDDVSKYNIDDSLIISGTGANNIQLQTDRTYYVVSINYTTQRIKLSETVRGTANDVLTSVQNTPAGLATAKRVFRLTDSWSERLSYTNSEEVVYGIKSPKANRMREFIFLPIEVQLPTEADTGEASCRLVLNYITPELIELIRLSLNSPANVKIELILTSSPGTIEAEFSNFFISNVTYSATQITLELSMVPYSREPFPAYNFTPLYFPGLF